MSVHNELEIQVPFFELFKNELNLPGWVYHGGLSCCCVCDDVREILVVSNFELEYHDRFCGLVRAQNGRPMFATIIFPHCLREVRSFSIPTFGACIVTVMSDFTT